MSVNRHYPVRIAHGAHGIRMQNPGVAGRQSWWARRWMASLEAMKLGARLGRGRQYAVSGQVTELEICGSEVRADVVGSRPGAYSVELGFTPAPEEAQRRIEERIASEPMLSGLLLSGSLPQEVAELFAVEGVALFPAGGSPGSWDIKMKCSCPDWARPCKHIVAVMLLLGEEIARRPLTLLSLRGVDPLKDLDETDLGADLPEPHMDASATQGDPAPLVRRLGPIPMWCGSSRCIESIERMAARVRPVADAASRGESVDLRGDDGI